MCAAARARRLARAAQVVGVKIRDADVLFHCHTLRTKVIILARAAAAVPGRVFVKRADIVGGDAVRCFFYARAVAVVGIVCRDACNGRGC